MNEHPEKPRRVGDAWVMASHVVAIHRFDDYDRPRDPRGCRIYLDTGACITTIEITALEAAVLLGWEQVP
jgi:hypothetical protein